MAGASDIRAARELLQEKGLLDRIIPVELVKAAAELKKPLREALEAIMSAMAEAEGSS